MLTYDDHIAMPNEMIDDPDIVISRGLVLPSEECTLLDVHGCARKRADAFQVEI